MPEPGEDRELLKTNLHLQLEPGKAEKYWNAG